MYEGLSLLNLTLSKSQTVVGLRLLPLFCVYLSGSAFEWEVLTIFSTRALQKSGLWLQYSGHQTDHTKSVLSAVGWSDHHQTDYRQTTH